MSGSRTWIMFMGGVMVKKETACCTFGRKFMVKQLVEKCIVIENLPINMIYNNKNQ